MNLRRKANNFWRDGFYLYLCNPFRNRNIGGVAEWSMAAVLKTVERQRSGGSNPSASAEIPHRAFCEGFFIFRVSNYVTISLLIRLPNTMYFYIHV